VSRIISSRLVATLFFSTIGGKQNFQTNVWRNAASPSRFLIYLHERVFFFSIQRNICLSRRRWSFHRSCDHSCDSSSSSPIAALVRAISICPLKSNALQIVTRARRRCVCCSNRYDAVRLLTATIFISLAESMYVTTAKIILLALFLTFPCLFHPYFHLKQTRSRK
jgi:hypothetical protein